jgi:hypothetical protein
LFAVDEKLKSDSINRITLDYHRITKIKPKEQLPKVAIEYVVWDYTENRRG